MSFSRAALTICFSVSVYTGSVVFGRCSAYGSFAISSQLKSLSFPPTSRTSIDFSSVSLLSSFCFGSFLNIRVSIAALTSVTSHPRRETCSSVAFIVFFMNPANPSLFART